MSFRKKLYDVFVINFLKICKTIFKAVGSFSFSSSSSGVRQNVFHFESSVLLNIPSQ